MLIKVLAWIVFLWWIPYYACVMVLDIIHAHRELNELKKKSGRK